LSLCFLPSQRTVPARPAITSTGRITRGPSAVELLVEVVLVVETVVLGVVDIEEVVVVVEPVELGEVVVDELDETEVPQFITAVTVVFAYIVILLVAFVLPLSCQ
jgi:hypothetical protein